jgi:mono/diheme cytochrome c family protein
MTKRLMILAGLFALASAGALRAQQPVDAPALYAKTCASCHGAKGSPSPTMAHSMHVPDFAAGAVASIPDSLLKSTIANGKPPMMPAYKSRFTAEQIAALVTYIRTFKQ